MKISLGLFLISFVPFTFCSQNTAKKEFQQQMIAKPCPDCTKHSCSQSKSHIKTSSESSSQQTQPQRTRRGSKAAYECVIL